MSTNVVKRIPKSRFQRELTSIIRNIQRQKYESLYVTRNNELWLVLLSCSVFDELTNKSISA